MCNLARGELNFNFVEKSFKSVDNAFLYSNVDFQRA